MMNTPLECCSISAPLEKICTDLETRKTLEDYNKIVILEKLSFSKGDLVVLGSRPGLGKTGLALSLTRKLAIYENKSRDVHVISGRYFEPYIRFDFN